VQQYFQRDLERAKKATADRTRERLKREEVAAGETIPVVNMMRKRCSSGKQSQMRVFPFLR
jgi:hypothetical protein